MKRTIFHIQIKATNEHRYYTSLVSCLLDNKEIGISLSYLQKYDWSQPFENKICILRKGFALSAGDVRRLCLYR